MSFDEREKKIFQDLGVSAIILFGSRAQGVSRDASDYDIFVIGVNTRSVYDALYDMISEKINTLVDIDILFENSAPMELKHHVARFGSVLFEKDASVFADFRQRVMTEYADFAPLRALYSNATLSRISL